MQVSFYLEPVMDQQNIASLFYGPVLLAAQEPAPLTDWRKVTLDVTLKQGSRDTKVRIRFILDVALKQGCQGMDSLRDVL